MFINLFHNKAVGFKFFDTFIKYAFITYTDNKIIVNETQLFNINCKTALHRLQHLLAKYPSCYLIDTSESTLNPAPRDIANAHDRKQIVKNKIESIINNNKVILRLFCQTKKTEASLLALQEKTLAAHEKKLLLLGLKPQKTILTNEALTSLDRLFLPPDDKVLILINQEKVECLFFNKKKLTFSAAFPASDLNSSQIEKKILRLLYGSYSNAHAPSLEFHGNHPNLDSLLTSIEKETGSFCKRVLYQNFEGETPHFLEEIGAAFSLLQKGEGGFQKENLETTYKLYKKPLFANAGIILGLFLLSFLFWNQKHSYIEKGNKALFDQSLSRLSENPKLYSNEQLSSLKEILSMKQKKSPSFLFRPKTFSVSDTLAWLSHISKDLGTGSLKEPITIESFKYSVVSSPTVKTPLTPHKVKVSFSFTTTSSQAARSIRDRIIKSSGVVDKTKKIDWGYHSDLYQVSFFLKDNLFIKERECLKDY